MEDGYALRSSTAELYTIEHDDNAYTSYKPKIVWNKGKHAVPARVREPFNAVYRVEFSNNLTNTVPKSISMNRQLLNEASLSADLERRLFLLAYRLTGEALAINPLSMQTFLNFWILIKQKAQEPELFPCPNGNLQAEWFKNKNNFLFIEFCNNRGICLFKSKASEMKAIQEIGVLSSFLVNHPEKPMQW